MAYGPSSRRANAYKLRLLTTAIKKHGSGYNPESDARATDFWLAYWREAVSRAPELEMRQPGEKTSAAGFVRFACADLPPRLIIRHKLARGFVDLHFTSLGNYVAQLRDALTSIVEPGWGWQVVGANKSAAVRIMVPVLNTALPFAEQEASLRQGIDAAKALRVWARLNREQLIEIESTLLKEAF